MAEDTFFVADFNYELANAYWKVQTNVVEYYGRGNDANCGGTQLKITDKGMTEVVAERS